MILEGFPEIADFTIEEKLRLTVELIDSITDTDGKSPDPEMASALGERLKSFQNGDLTTSNWSDVKERIAKSRSR